MIMLFIIAAIVSLLVGFYLGGFYAYKKHKQDLLNFDKAWREHCNAVKEHYRKVLMSRNGKCTCDEKVLFQGKYEIDPCAYKVKEKYHNVTIEVLECKKCGHTEISWFKQDDTEKVEVE